MDKQPMKMRAFRCGPIWEAAQAKADTRGETLAEVIRKALERYVNRNDEAAHSIGRGRRLGTRGVLDAHASSEDHSDTDSGSRNPRATDDP